jgi:3-isopropylmalate/(R)-2-methylmalate dehydratase small subunit
MAGMHALHEIRFCIPGDIHMKLTGKIWKFPQDDINTGLIRKQMYNHLPPQEQGKYCMESLDPQFSSKAQAGDFIVAGTNLGCGSSTPAHYSIVALGIAAVIAESFAPLFFSNCAGGALWPVACPGILGLVETGDTIELDTDSFVVRNIATGKTLQGRPLPQMYRAMIEAGGEKPYLKARLAAERSRA